MIADLTPALEAAPEPEPLPEASQPNVPQVGFSGQPATVLPERTGAVHINRPDGQTAIEQAARALEPVPPSAAEDAFLSAIAGGSGDCVAQILALDRNSTRLNSSHSSVSRMPSSA